MNEKQREAVKEVNKKLHESFKTRKMYNEFNKIDNKHLIQHEKELRRLGIK